MNKKKIRIAVRVILFFFSANVLMSCTSGVNTNDEPEMNLTEVAGTIIAEITQTAVTNVTPTPKVIQTSISTTDFQSYVDTITDESNVCTTALNDLSSLAVSASNDLNLMNDSKWISLNLIDLSVIETICGNMGKTSDIPEQFKQSNEYLLLANSEFKEYARLYRIGIIGKDTDTINEATAHLTIANNYLNLVMAAIN